MTHYTHTHTHTHTHTLHIHTLHTTHLVALTISGYEVYSPHHTSSVVHHVSALENLSFSFEFLLLYQQKTVLFAMNLTINVSPMEMTQATRGTSET